MLATNARCQNQTYLTSSWKCVAEHGVGEIVKEKNAKRWHHDVWYTSKYFND